MKHQTGEMPANRALLSERRRRASRPRAAGTSLKPLQRLNLVQEVVERLRKQIIAGAFGTAVIVGLLDGRGLDAINEHANCLASYVCSQAGATPRIPDKVGMYPAQLRQMVVVHGSQKHSEKSWFGRYKLYKCSRSDVERA